MAVTLKYRSGTPTASAPGARRRAGSGRGLLRLLLLAVVAVVLVAAIAGLLAYRHYGTVVDQRLAAGPLFAPVTQIYAAPREVRAGQTLTATEIAADLRRAGYAANSQLGTYELRDPDTIFIKPGPQSFHSTDGATITTTGGVVQSVTAESGAPLAAYQLEPQLITALSEDKSRTKRRLVTYNEIPVRLVEAVTAIEDRRFFDHGGVDYHRIGGAIYHDLFGHSRVTEGGSTITMQLARGFFLSPTRTLQRKISEIFITFQLESRYSKQQIFEMYANQINLGQRGSFGVNGFGEAAQAFFGKDLRQLSTAQYALLAGLIQSPNHLNPYRHPERAVERRNLVLGIMGQLGEITPAEVRAAQAEPLHLAPQNVDASDAPYFVDLVHDQLNQRVSDQEQSHDSLRIYTSLDPELQRIASEAVEIGMRNVDAMIAKRKRGNGDSSAPPQVALVALNPHTGQVLALVGGRNYNSSQLNHAVSKRPTGSIFKPFVYAAAYNSSLNGMSLDESGVFTAVTRLNDDPQNFGTNGQSYTPGNFVRGEYPGMVTAATALEHSLNVATIALAQKVGYENVAALARSAGIVAARGTPSVALGTYSATPIEMAGAYTTFANGGVHLNPWLLSSVRNVNGDIVSDFTPQAQQVMDPRSAFLTQSLLEGVMARGTGSAARRFGFNAPAAGKTGTSHDVWFAGYSTNLLCIVWVGNDDYTDVKMQGATAAAPIWGEFMKRAQKLPQYSDMKSFTAPSGVQVLRIDKASNLIADATCPDNFVAAFLDGTAPQNTCSQMGESPQNFVNRIMSNDGSPYENPAAGGTAPLTPQGQPYPAQPASADATNPDGSPKKKKGFFGRLFGSGDKEKPQPAAPPQ